MIDQQPATPPGAHDFLLGCLGTIMLLPGLCSLVFAIGASQLFRGDPVAQSLGLVGLLIGAGGVALITFANRRKRRS